MKYYFPKKFRLICVVLNVLLKGVLLHPHTLGKDKHARLVPLLAYTVGTMIDIRASPREFSNDRDVLVDQEFLWRSIAGKLYHLGLNS